GGLDVALEEALGEVIEDLAAVQTEIGGGEAAARDARNLVDLVDEAAHAPVERHVGDCELLEHAVRECSRARSATREGEHEQELVGRVGARVQLVAIALIAVPVLERSIDAEVGAAAERGERDRGSESPRPTLPAQAAPRRSGAAGSGAR